jgi:WD40 repeat protein
MSITVLWDANTGVTLSVIRYHKKGVSNVLFSTSGLLLISLGMDEDRSIAVHNVKTSALVGTGKGGRGKGLVLFYPVTSCIIMF